MRDVKCNRLVLAAAGAILVILAFIGFAPKVAQEWQTLIAGSFAILAAWVGGHYLNKQIRTTERLEKARRDGKFAAARAILPLTLSALSEYCGRCAHGLRSMFAKRSGEVIPAEIELPDYPAIPSAVITGLREVIEFADKPVSDALATILDELQVHTARLNEIWQRHSPPAQRSSKLHDVEEYLLDTASIYARASALFPFAQRKTEVAPGEPSQEEILSALRLLGCRGQDFDRIVETAKRRYKPKAAVNPAPT